MADPFVESFHARVRDELLNGEQFACIAEARVLVDDWREDYNQRRPHSSLGMLAPAVFAVAYHARRRCMTPLSSTPRADGSSSLSSPSGSPSRRASVRPAS